MKLVHIKPALKDSGQAGRVDVCDLENGHGGSHKGRYKGVEWTGDATGHQNIISHGGSTVATERHDDAA